MAKELSFRWAEAGDFEAVLSLATQLAHHIEEKTPSLTPSDFATYHLGPEAPMRLRLAIDDGRVVGMISWTLMHELYCGKKRVFISDVSVDRAARGRGVGIALMAGVKAWAQAHGAAKLTWEVWYRNASAKTFYEQLGATVDDEAVPYGLMLTDGAG